MVEKDANMRSGFLHSSRYSPGNLDRDSLETLFVGRRDVMNDVLTRATRSIETSQKHYLLLVGPRGSGKTHFLALAHPRLMDYIEAVGAADLVAVARLKEEELGVASYLDLTVRILRALANESPNSSRGSPMSTPPSARIRQTRRRSLRGCFANTLAARRSCSFARTSSTCSTVSAMKARSAGGPPCSKTAIGPSLRPRPNSPLP